VAPPLPAVVPAVPDALPPVPVVVPAVPPVPVAPALPVVPAVPLPAVPDEPLPAAPGELLPVVPLPQPALIAAIRTAIPMVPPPRVPRNRGRADARDMASSFWWTGLWRKGGICVGVGAWTPRLARRIAPQANVR
jgi:hypothetical protein